MVEKKPAGGATSATKEWKDGPYTISWDEADGWPIWTRYDTAKPYYSANNGPADVYLDRTLPDVADHTWVVLEDLKAGLRMPFWVAGVTESSVTGFALSARATGLCLAGADGTLLSSRDPIDAATNPLKGEFRVRPATAHATSFPLVLADLPITDDVAEGGKQLQLNQMVLGLQQGQGVALTGERSDLPGVFSSEIAFLDEILHEDGLTTLFFKEPLKYSYARARPCGSTRTWWAQRMARRWPARCWAAATAASRTRPST